MSEIFDALQRSESERSGMSRAALSEPTEMLRRVEKDETTKWESTAQVSELDEFGIAEHEKVGAVADRSVETAFEADLEVSGAVLDSTRGDVFGQFHELELALPPDSRLVSITSPEHPATEAFRLLSVRLKALRRKRIFRRVLITSTIPQEGKSTVSSNLACTLAKDPEQKVLLLEGDVRRPSLPRMLGLGNPSGLCEYLRGDRQVTDSVYHLTGAGIWFLPAGDAQGKPLEHLQSNRLPELMEKLSEWFDWIVIDSPPVLPLADTSVWSRIAEGILLVARQGVTERRALKRGLEALDRQKVIGALLNSSRCMPHSNYYYYYQSSNPHQED